MFDGCVLILICKVNARLWQGSCKVRVVEWDLTDDNPWELKNCDILLYVGVLTGYYGTFKTVISCQCTEGFTDTFFLWPEILLYVGVLIGYYGTFNRRF